MSWWLWWWMSSAADGSRWSWSGAWSSEPASWWVEPWSGAWSSEPASWWVGAWSSEPASWWVERGRRGRRRRGCHPGSREGHRAVARRRRPGVAEHVAGVVRDGDDQLALRAAPGCEDCVVGVHQRIGTAGQQRRRPHRGPRPPRIGRDVQREFVTPVAVDGRCRHPLPADPSGLHRELGPVPGEEW